MRGAIPGFEPSFRARRGEPRRAIVEDIAKVNLVDDERISRAGAGTAR
jgi:hypothetical protein